MAICDKCGEEDCDAKRAAFHREPWLPGGFELGAQWTSYDNGMTWHRFPPPDLTNRIPGRTGAMTVIAIDARTGEIVVKVSP